MFFDDVPHAVCNAGHPGSLRSHAHLPFDQCIATTLNTHTHTHTASSSVMTTTVAAHTPFACCSCCSCAAGLSSTSPNSTATAAQRSTNHSVPVFPSWHPPGTTGAMRQRTTANTLPTTSPTCPATIAQAGRSSRSMQSAHMTHTGSTVSTHTAALWYPKVRAPTIPQERTHRTVSRIWLSTARTPAMAHGSPPPSATPRNKHTTLKCCSPRGGTPWTPRAG